MLDASVIQELVAQRSGVTVSVQLGPDFVLYARRYPNGSIGGDFDPSDVAGNSEAADKICSRIKDFPEALS